MKALVLEANEKLVYKNVPFPEPGEGELRIRIAMCGICGSDLPRVYNHGARSYPLILGHEFCGLVDALGEDVQDFSIGDHVVGAPLIPCHKCEDCRRGDYSLCEKYSFAGSRQNGAFAEYMIIPARNVLKISQALPWEQAATIEPATVALHALRHCGFKPGKSVAVLGCGIIGLYMIQCLRILGAAQITAISRSQEGLDAALRQGADCIISTAETSPEDIKERFQYVFECAGADQTMHLTLRLVDKKGCVCYVGTPKNGLELSVAEWEQINRKECWITGSWMSYSAPFPGTEWTDAIRYMEQGLLINDPGLVYATYPMEEGAKAFDLIHRGKAKGRVLLNNHFGVHEI